jgi:hypothetical protein
MAAEPAVFARSEHDPASQARAIEGFPGLHVVQMSPHDVVFVILGDNVEVLDQIATEWARQACATTLFLASTGRRSATSARSSRFQRDRDARSSLLIGTRVSDRGAVAHAGGSRA